MKIELTEDQAYDLIGLIESFLPSQEWWIGQYESYQRQYAIAKPDLKRYIDREYSKEHYETTQRKIAFRKRLLTKLAQSVVTEQSAKTQNNS